MSGVVITATEPLFLRVNRKGVRKLLSKGTGTASFVHTKHAATETRHFMQKNGNNGARNHAGRAQARCNLFREGVDGAVGVILIPNGNCNGGFGRRATCSSKMCEACEDGKAALFCLPTTNARTES